MAAREFRQFESIDEALEVRRIPLANRPMIRAFVAAIGCSRFEETTSYIKVTRRDGGPTLQVAYGWSSGFASREEAEMTGAADVWESKRQGLFGVTHPVHKYGGSRSGARSPETSGRMCPSCYCEIPLADEECPDCSA